MLGLASCQKDFNDTTANLGGEVDFQLCVGAGEATRADLDGDEQEGYDSAHGAIDYLSEADWAKYDLRYTLEVYDVANDYTNATPVKDRMVQIVDSYEAVNFDLRLVPNRDYRFVVFADFVPNGASEDANVVYQSTLGLRHIIGDTLGDIEIKNDAINDEIADAYFAAENIKISNSAAQDIVLKRPYGKVRVIATDLAELNLNVNPKAVKVVYTAAHPAAFNAVTGAISTEYSTVEYKYVYGDITKESLDNHVYTAGYDNKDPYFVENANGDIRHTHMTLFTDYILAEKNQTPYHFTLSVYEDAKFEQPIKETVFNTDIPVERNMLTTVIGNVLTTATEINVTIDDNFKNFYNYNLWNGWEVKEPKIEGVNYYIYESSELAWLSQQVNEKNQKFNGKTFWLCKDLHLNHERWTPIGATGKFEGTFDGQGHNIEGLFVSVKGKANAGLFANAKYVKNLTVLNSQVYGQYKAGVIVADGVCSRITNCHVDGCEVVSTPYNKDEANNVGGIVGYLSGETEAYVKECTVKNSRIVAYRKVGGIAGAANQTAVVSGNRVDNVVVVADMTAEYNEVKAADAGAIVGYVHAKATVENNTIGEDNSVNVLIDTNQERDESYAVKDEVIHVTFKEGTYDFSQNLKVNGAVQAKLGGTVVLNVDGKTITSGTTENYGLIVDGEGNTLVINNANAVSYGGGVAAGEGAKVIFNGGKVDITNYTKSSPARYNFYTFGGEIVINDGEFTFGSTNKTRRAYVSVEGGGKVIINGGTFGKASTRDGYTGIRELDGEVLIYGGTFGFDPSAWVAPGYVAKKNGANWVVEAIPASSNISEAISTVEDGGTIVLEEGNYTMPSTGGKDVTIVGNKNTVITINKPNMSGSDVTLHGVTVKGSGYATGIQHVNSVNFNDVKVIGEMCLYGEAVTFNNCEFELASGKYIWTYGCKNVEFNNSTFNTAGKAILVYNEGAGANNVVVKGCVFNATEGAKAGAIANQNCAAIEIDNFQSSGVGAAHNVTASDNKFDNKFSGEWRIKNFVDGNAITVNGVAYEQIAIDGKLMTIDANKNVTVE